VATDAAAVAYLQAEPGVAGTSPALTAQGDDPNIHIVIKPKGVGVPVMEGVRNYADDAAAAAGGVPLNGVYRTGNALKIRIV
jgi:hypothetical protein